MIGMDLSNDLKDLEWKIQKPIWKGEIKAFASVLMIITNEWLTGSDDLWIVLLSDDASKGLKWKT